MELNMNSVNQVSKGNVLYTQNKPIESICLVVKGRVLVYNSGMRIVFGPGSFLGVSDLEAGRYEATYYAIEDITIYPLPIKRVEEVRALLEGRSEYRGTMVSALNRHIAELYNIHTALQRGADSLCAFLRESYEEYKSIGKKSSISTIAIPELENLEEHTNEDMEDDVKALYYMECATLPLEVQKAYYSHGSQICIHHIEEQIEILIRYREECKELTNYIQKAFQGVMNEKEECLYKAAAKLVLDIRKIKGKSKPLLDMMDKLKDKIKEMETLFSTKTGRKLNMDQEKVEQIYGLLSVETSEEEEEMSTESAVKYAGRDTEAIEAELSNSFDKIIAYSELPKEKCEEFEAKVLEFIALKDKNDTEDAARKLRKTLTNLFYEFYEAIFLKDYKEKSKSRLIEMFLSYGYLDERMLTKEQLLELYCLQDQDNGGGPCKVYNIKQWLTAVYEGKKEPSKSEFDMDYMETLREMKKNGQIREEEMKVAKEDPLQKLKYEISNMFRYNNRIVSGQLSIFVPFLHKDLFMGHIDQSFLTTNKINAVIKKILSIDYSIFYRESMYNNEEKGIDKAFIMSQAFPDIILLPTYGTNGAMWQEITGKRRTSSGRFLFPAFSEVDMEDIFIRVCGRFRWELCRTIQGTAWNDVKYKSLTSEYVDYIQFYRKNRSLSEEKREKLKMQIQKGRGNTREIFVIDYVLWVKNEAMGSLRLNKVAREILAMYCPFTKEIRKKVESQPLFEEAMARFNRERLKKVKELDLRYRSMENKKIELTEELLHTMEFYRDM